MKTRMLRNVGILAALLASAVALKAAWIDVIDASDAQAGTYFTPDDASKYSSPYYRWAGEDWDWQHTAYAGSYTTATLSISAFDVDAGSGELDVIAIVNGAPIVVGSLAGASDVWSYTSFDVSALAAQIALGLKVEIRIDENNQGWAVTLAKSVLTLDGATPPPPQPGVPDGGASLILLGLGALGLGAVRRFQKA